MATHDPLVLSALRREQVIVLDRAEESRRVEISYPELDPAGLGISGILRNYFLLRSTLDLPTQAKLDERFELLGKGKNRTKADIRRLKQLSEELADAGFASEHRDANFELFAQAMGQARGELPQSMTRKESESVHARALEIARKLVANETSK